VSVSVIVITDGTTDNEKIKNYWTPVKLKFKDREVELIFTADKSDGIRRAKYNAVFITPWNMVPTYKTLLAFETLKANQCLLPRVQGDHDTYANAFSINKKLYNGESSLEWSTRKDITVIETTTMYKV
jgi:hypothetical protein